MDDADKKRLTCIDACCREIILCIRENGDDYTRFVKNEETRRSVFERLNCISSMACGLSPQIIERFRKNDLHPEYLSSLRFWVPAAEDGGERMWRVAWEIAVHDCTDLLLFVAKLLKK